MLAFLRRLRLRAASERERASALVPVNGACLPISARHLDLREVAQDADALIGGNTLVMDLRLRGEQSALLCGVAHGIEAPMGTVLCLKDAHVGGRMHARRLILLGTLGTKAFQSNLHCDELVICSTGRLVNATVTYKALHVHSDAILTDAQFRKQADIRRVA